MKLYKCTRTGDVIELVGSSDNGLLEGVLRGATGFFARELVQVSSYWSALLQVISYWSANKVPWTGLIFVASYFYDLIYCDKKLVKSFEVFAACRPLKCGVSFFVMFSAGCSSVNGIYFAGGQAAQR